MDSKLYANIGQGDVEIPIEDGLVKFCPGWATKKDIEAFRSKTPMRSEGVIYLDTDDEVTFVPALEPGLRFSSVQDMARAIFDVDPTIVAESEKVAEPGESRLGVTGCGVLQVSHAVWVGRIKQVMWDRTKPREREAAETLAKAIWTARGMASRNLVPPTDPQGVPW